MEDCIKPFRLTTDAMNRIFKILIKINRFLEKACLCETILQVTIKDFSTISLQILPITFPAIFPSIECIQKNTTDETDFCLTITCACIRPKMYTRIIHQWVFINKTTYKELTKSLLHILN